MNFRNLSLKALTGAALVSLTMLSAARADDAPPDALTALVKQAERILIGTIEKNPEAAPGEEIQVEILDVLRGTGKQGTLARIFNSGDEKQYPRYKKDQQYVFLLKKRTGATGWNNLGNREIEIKDGQVIHSEGAKGSSMALADFRDLAAGVDISRETIAGKWLMLITEADDGMDIPFWLVDVAKNAKGAWETTLLGSTPGVLKAVRLDASTVTDRDVKLVFLADGNTMDFRGKFDKGVVRGSLAVGGMLIPARMMPSELTAIPADIKPTPIPGFDDFTSADTIEELQKFIQENPGSPLVLDAYDQLTDLARDKRYKEPEFKKLAEGYLEAASRWGARIELKSLVELGVTLSRSDYLPQLAIEYLNAAEKKFTAETPDRWKLLVKTEVGKRLLQGDDPAEGLTILRQLHTSNPFEGEITWLLARQADKDKDVDGAIRLYGELVGLPMLERQVAQTLMRGGQRISRNDLPGATLERLWKGKHGDTKGLSDYLVSIYDGILHTIAGPRQPSRKAGQGTRVVLCELFTGSSCPPCVAADAATTALEAAYSPTEVVVLRYHQHVPAPDPLATREGEERFSAYGGEGTPTLCVNGKPFEGAGGFMDEVAGIYKRLRETVDPYLAENSGLKLELSAKATQGVIAISAKSAGLATFPPELRLRLVLAEDKVDFLAPNGIRSHEMVVRAMPGGAGGIAPAKGQLTWTGEVDLARLKADLTKSLASVEKQMNREFDEKPLELKALHLVGILQNEQTSEVLQVASIPVTGLAPDAAPAKETPAPAKKAESVDKAGKAKAPAGKK